MTNLKYYWKDIELMKNKYHRYINLPFIIEKPEDKVFHTFWDDVQHIDLGSDNLYSKKMINWLKQFGLTTSHVDMFYTPPNGGKIMIHTDSNEFNDQTKINISWGPAEGVVRFWKTDKYRKLTTTYDEDSRAQHAMNLWVANEEDCELIYEANTDKASLVNSGTLHSTYNPGTVGRHTLTFHLAYINGNDFVPWDTAEQLLKEFLI